MAMLRYLYDLPYTTDDAHWEDDGSMLLHAKVYTVAEKYELEGLKSMVYDQLCYLIHFTDDRPDLIPTIREIITGTPESDRLARKLILNHCTLRLSELSKSQDFMALLKDRGELGAAIITEQVRGSEIVALKKSQRRKKSASDTDWGQSFTQDS